MNSYEKDRLKSQQEAVIKLLMEEQQEMSYVYQRVSNLILSGDMASDAALSYLLQEIQKTHKCSIGKVKEVFSGESKAKSVGAGKTGRPAKYNSYYVNYICSMYKGAKSIKQIQEELASKQLIISDKQIRRILEQQGLYKTKKRQEREEQ